MPLARFLAMLAPLGFLLALITPVRAQEVDTREPNNKSPQAEVDAQGVKLAEAPKLKATSAEPAATPRPTPSENVTVNLVHRMVDRGLLSASDAEELIKQAESDAQIARAHNASLRTTSTADSSSSPLPAPDVPSFADGTAADPRTPSEGPPVPASGEDEVRVTYVPEIVKQQLRDEIREDVLQQAREENWASPRTFPAWALRLTPFA